MTLIYIQMPVFRKTESKLKTRLDKRLYFLKHLASLEHIPAILNEKVFKKAFKTAETAAMPEPEQEAYDQSRNEYWTYRRKSLHRQRGFHLTK
ncbi:MAG: Rpn family recombination-promoting nuclease/putative transposase [Planctomycetaceae bacterium]|nr:Rpn family recombination-promoting nuclease/putative transposase [Planctomycetaceae bacterium]